MPYIKEEDKVEFQVSLDNLPVIDHPGKLNYLVTKVCHAYIKNNGLNYRALNDISGALTNANLEMYRRISSPYEDQKIRENGDVKL